MGIYPARNKIKLLEEWVKFFGTCTCICLWTVSVNSWNMISIQNGNSLVHNGCNKWQLLSLFWSLQIEYFGSKIIKNTWKTITVSKWFDKWPSCFIKGLATLHSLTGANDSAPNVLYNKTEWVFFTTDVLLTCCSLLYTHQKGCHSSYIQDFRRCLLQISAGILAIKNVVFHGFPHFPQANVRIQA